MKSSILQNDQFKKKQSSNCNQYTYELFITRKEIQFGDIPRVLFSDLTDLDLTYYQKALFGEMTKFYFLFFANKIPYIITQFFFSIIIIRIDLISRLLGYRENQLSFFLFLNIFRANFQPKQLKSICDYSNWYDLVFSIPRVTECKIKRILNHRQTLKIGYAEKNAKTRENFPPNKSDILLVTSAYETQLFIPQHINNTMIIISRFLLFIQVESNGNLSHKKKRECRNGME